jgi:hypothetical protein
MWVAAQLYPTAVGADLRYRGCEHGYARVGQHQVMSDATDWDSLLAVRSVLDAQLVAMQTAGYVLADNDTDDGLYPRVPSAVGVQAGRAFDLWLHGQPSRHWPALLSHWSSAQMAYLRGYLDRRPAVAPSV